MSRAPLSLLLLTAAGSEGSRAYCGVLPWAAYVAEGLAVAPLRLGLHPQNPGYHELGDLEEFLTILEVHYDVRYLRVEDVPGYRARNENIY